METRTCPECGKELPGPTNICSHCGNKIDPDRHEHPNRTYLRGCFSLVVAMLTFSSAFICAGLIIWL